MTDVAQRERLLSLVLANRWNAQILERLPQMGLEDWWLTAGCIAQSVWNGLYGRAPTEGILDYDIFYFDSDTSWEVENGVIARTASLFADLPIAIQIRNQARVPLWYQDKFGAVFPPVRAAGDGIDRFPCRTVAVGVRRNGNGYDIHAPYGLEPLFSGLLIPNTTLDVPAVYAEKTKRWREVWPELCVVAWPDDCAGRSFAQP